MAARTPTTAKAVVDGPPTKAKVVAIDEATPGPAKASRKSEALARELDALSLTQALRDFEVANARVIDLSRRIIEANEHTLELQRELDRLAAAFHVLNVEHHALRTSGAYRLSEKILALRNLLRG
jgi:hypothetical protein